MTQVAPGPQMTCQCFSLASLSFLSVVVFDLLCFPFPVLPCFSVRLLLFFFLRLFGKACKETPQKTTKNIEHTSQNCSNTDQKVTPGLPLGAPRAPQERKHFSASFLERFLSILAPSWDPLGGPWAGFGEPKRNKNEPKGEKRHEKEASKKSS